MSFSKEGFFSAGMEHFHESVRNIAEFRPWLDFGHDLVRFGLSILEAHEVQQNDRQRLTAMALFIRAHKSLQAAIMTAERGLSGDARVILRSAVEGVIAMNAVANDPSFVDAMVKDSRSRDRKVARLIRDNADYRPHLSSEQIAQLESVIAEVDKMETEANTMQQKRGQAPKKFSEIIWANVAGKHCPDLYELLYRPLSTDGAHTTITAIQRNLEFGASGALVGLRSGPDINGLVQTLSFACNMFLWAVVPFDRLFPRNGLAARIQEQLQRFDQLPKDEPTDARVVEVN